MDSDQRHGLVNLRKQINEFSLSAVVAAMTSAESPPLVCLVSICDATGLSTRIFCGLKFDSAEHVALEIAVNEAVQAFIYAIPEIAAARAAGQASSLRYENGDAKGPA